MFPDEVRQFVKGGANLLVNISNDGYFGHSAAREQHLEIARMRAVENSRWLIRSTNDGITAVIDPAGRIDERLPLYQELVGTHAFRVSQRHHVLHQLRRLVRVGLSDRGGGRAGCVRNGRTTSRS